MSNIPLHPALVHLPLGIAVVLPIVAAFIAFLIFRGVDRRAFFVVVGLELLLVGSGLLALRSGESEEERVESLVGEAQIEAHEHAAQRFVMAGAITLLLSGGAALFRDRRKLGFASLGVTGATALVALLAVQTGKAGGELVYGNNGVSVTANSGALPTANAEDHDDD